MIDFDYLRRHHWTREQIDAHDDEWLEEGMYACAGWDEAVAELRARAAQRAAPAPSSGRPVFGAPGMTA